MNPKQRKNNNITNSINEPACDKSEYTSCKICQRKWGHSLPPCVDHPYHWIGTDECGYHHIFVSYTEDIEIIKYKVIYKQLLWLSVLGPGNNDYVIMVMPHKITHEWENGFNINVTLIGGDNFTGELILSNKYLDAEIVLSDKY